MANDTPKQAPPPGYRWDTTKNPPQLVPTSVPYSTPSGPGAIGNATPAPPGTTIGTLPNALQPPAAGPAAPPPMPGAEHDSEYNNDLAAAQAAWEQATARIGLGESRLAWDTGYGADGKVDLSNPYSQAMMLQRYKLQNARGIQSSMASRGQLYSGARSRAQDENNFQYERGSSDLQTAAQRGYQDFGLARQDAASARTDAGYAADANQAERWRNAQRDWYALYGS